MVVVSGLNAPALLLVVPPVKDGTNGNAAPGHGLPFGPEVTSKPEELPIGALPDHGVNDALVVYVPQCDGVVSGARSPPKKCTSRFSNGTCGVFANVEVICPVLGFSETLPGSLTSTPEIGSSARMYIATSELNGFSFCAARYTEPFNGCASNGVVIDTSPIFDAFGQNGLLSVGVNRSVSEGCSTPSNPISPSEHASRPLAPDGFSAMPAGSVTVVSFTSAPARPVPLRLASWGTCILTVKPEELLACCTSGETSSEALNGSLLQPTRLSVAALGPNAGSGVGSFHESTSTDVCNGPVHDVGSVRYGGG